jgi:hypothetical protein
VKKARLLLRVPGSKLDVSVVLHNPEGDALAFSAAATGTVALCKVPPHPASPAYPTFNGGRSLNTKSRLFIHNFINIITMLLPALTS